MKNPTSKTDLAIDYLKHRVKKHASVGHRVTLEALSSGIFPFSPRWKYTVPSVWTSPVLDTLVGGGGIKQMKTTQTTVVT